MNTVKLIRDELKHAHEAFVGTMDGVTNEVAHRQPGGLRIPSVHVMPIWLFLKI
jgi:hypothetical protein